MKPYKPYWLVLVTLVAWLAAIAGAIALVWWLTVLWLYTPIVLLGIGFVMVFAFGIWVDQG